MICPICGGDLFLNQNCLKCKTSYSEVITGIKHDEMKELFIKIENQIKNHRSIEIEESLLACELANSSLLIPLTVNDGGLAVMTIEDAEKRIFILLFTDKEEYDKNNAIYGL